MVGGVKRKKLLSIGGDVAFWPYRRSPLGAPEKSDLYSVIRGINVLEYVSKTSEKIEN
jgi:hypothetical protein